MMAAGSGIVSCFYGGTSCLRIAAGRVPGKAEGLTLGGTLVRLHVFEQGGFEYQRGR